MSEPHVKQKRYQRRSAEAIAGSSPVLTAKWIKRVVTTRMTSPTTLHSQVV